ncbi:Isoflavone reductase-like protein [Vitis vinifera]|uniref:Isoflavone reductase-like protein n=1 Tax=Vitis vinifera TaxID=29760 RepID=A0A438JTE5_VITVI|nr:Isoflavone reductase-like protein [Vitis vinifera]
MADKILIIGGTGYIGKFIVAASAKSGHPTFALVRDTTLSDPTKSQIIKSFKSSGVTLVHVWRSKRSPEFGKAIKEVDVVISTVGGGQLQDQAKIIAAIKEAGNVKRFLPSEFGNDVDRLHAVEPAKSVFAIKVQIRRAIEAEGIPYTYVTSNFFAGYFLPTLVQPGATAPPKDKVIILGDGNPKAPQNIYSFNDLVSLWEKKIGKTLERIHVPKEQVLKNIQEAEFPVNVIMAISHSVFIEGDQTNFEIEPSFGVEASELYPDVKYTTVDEYLNQFA